MFMMIHVVLILKFWRTIKNNKIQMEEEKARINDDYEKIMNYELWFDFDVFDLHGLEFRQI